MLHRVLLFLSALAGLMCFGAHADHTGLTLYTENFPPYNYQGEQGTPDGFSVAVLNEISRRLKQPVHIRVVPFKRAMKDVEDQPNRGVFSLYRTEDRAFRYKWVGPLTSANVALLAHRDNPITLGSLTDARRVGSIGVQEGSAYHYQLMSLGFANLDTTAAALPDMAGTPNIHRLYKHRIDLWLATVSSARAKARAMHYDPNEMQIAWVIARDDLYLAFNLDTEDALIRDWQAALDQLKREPLWLQWEQQYLH
ncbi:substrate-binding periplasmic protein [Atopomonas sediminilitoris]|uniref:substrate-binding periplasmic protein n=1 Tax=Atopomonas sediminilitoris TaxID=2919919 RepID=UPI001F4F04B4|nr:transporter substrate-binding domain-containing protein [Atopomonas sediminilitoris]MCJ8169487.1 transporter substrate-binding domain-containing protein [Atopomonas sediminilitoris]